MMDEPRIIQIGNIIRPDKRSTRRNPNCERVYSIDGLCPVLNTRSGGGLEPKILERMKDFKIIGYSRPSDDWRKPSTYHTKDVANTIHQFTGGGWNTDQFVLEYDMKKNDLSRAESIAKTHGGRIRKLTPRECLRLQDVSEDDIDKMMSCGISDSQLYKIAGNSIVVNVLVKIFEKLLINPQPENGEQLKLF